jgi:hypothetical protein
MKQGMLPLNVLPPREVCCIQKTRIPAKTVDRGKKSASRIALDVAIEVKLLNYVHNDAAQLIIRENKNDTYAFMCVGLAGSKEPHPSGNRASRNGQECGA